MKSKIAIILSVICLTFSNSAFADGNSMKIPENPDLLILVPSSEGRKDRPRSPAKAADIECYYYDGYICIAFDEPEGNASLLLEDMVTSESATYTFSTSAPFAVYVGEPSGILRLQLTTEDGNTYVGYLSE